MVHHLWCLNGISLVFQETAKLWYSITFRALLVGQIQKANACQCADQENYIKPTVVEVEL